MIEFDNGGILLQDGDELPNLRGARDLFLDAETSSGDPAIKSLNPWKVKHCKVAGLAVTVDDAKRSWYIPRRLINLDWLADLMDDSETWSNHNVKYDAHVLHNDLGLSYEGDYYDTLTQAKIIDSDRGFKGGYSLEALAETWLLRDVRYLKRRFEPWLAASNDYGDIPEDLIGEYACQDVFDARDLKAYCKRNMPDECQEISETEQRLTKLLVQVERRGLKIEPHDVKTALRDALMRMCQIEEELHKITGRMINPASSNDCYDLIINQYGLPPLEYTIDKDTGESTSNPSFSKKVLKQYAVRLDAPRDVIKLLLAHRTEHTHASLFYEPWLALHVDGVLHSDYNQMVRSGRMSCKNPNAQQLDMKAKRLIVPRAGYAFIELDYSQIEYRLIVHYINNTRAINQYKIDPRTDYHVYIANEIGIVGKDGRRNGKTANFLFGFGGGKKRGIKFLSTLHDLFEEGMTPLEMERLAISIYEKYHRNLPELKPTTRRATRVVQQRGHIRNMHGRRSHLPFGKAHVGFSRLVQSDAADIMKERVLELDLKQFDTHLIALVHDSALFEVPVQLIGELYPIIQNCLETMGKQYRVPILADGGCSFANWSDCKNQTVRDGRVEAA